MLSYYCIFKKKKTIVRFCVLVTVMLYVLLILDAGRNTELSCALNRGLGLASTHLLVHMCALLILVSVGVLSVHMREGSCSGNLHGQKASHDTIP